jgi:hypothetical protein
MAKISNSKNNISNLIRRGLKREDRVREMKS